MTQKFSHIGDIDIDVADREAVAKLFPEAIPAAQKAKDKDGNVMHDGTLTRHNTGLHFSDVPWDPVAGIAAVDFKEAERRGFFKLDVLTLSLYRDVRDTEHLDALMATEPDWSRLLDRDFVSRLVQVGNHARTLEIVRPESVPELAAVLALIRPGKKRLVDDYRAGKLTREKLLTEAAWTKDPESGYAFKKSHATAYALTVVVHMNLLAEKDA